MRRASDDESIGASLARRLRAMGMGRPAEAAFICQQADTLAAGRFQAIMYRNNTLTLRAINAIVAHELRMGVDELQREIHTKLGWPAERVLRIRIIVEG